MRTKHIEISSRWKSSFIQELIEQDSDTLVILLPGNQYTTMAPLLYYSYNMALQLKYDVLAMDYGFQRTGETLLREEVPYVVAECKEIIDCCLQSNQAYKKLIFIAKCAGTGILAELAKEYSHYEQCNVFLTPMVRSMEAIHHSRSLVIVGSEDGHFQESHIQEISNKANVTVKLLQGANHDLDTEDFESSIDLLKEAVKEIFNNIKQ